ncbi:kinase-like protein [Serendipita vermifera]|nr:kinase-like protein [Serendipita vermifera]
MSTNLPLPHERYTNKRSVQNELVRDWTSSLSSLMVFATLLSAIICSLLVESTKLLKQDDTDVVLHKLNFLLKNYEAGAHAPYTPEPFSPAPFASDVNFMLFSGLLISIIVAPASMLALRWVDMFDPGIRSGRPSSGKMTIRRQYQNLWIKKWTMPKIVNTLSNLLYCSAIVSLTGLAHWILNIKTTPGAVLLAGFMLCISFYFGLKAVAILSPSVLRILPGLDPSHIGHLNEYGNGCALLSSHDLIYDPPLNPLQHVQASFQPLVTLLYPPFGGDGYTSNEGSGNDPILTLLGVPPCPILLPEPSLSTTGYDLDGIDEDNDITFGPQILQYIPEEDIEPQWPQDPEVSINGDTDSTTTWSERESYDHHQESSVQDLIESPSQDESPAPEISGLVQKLGKRPVFEGTYSRVFAGEYNGTKVAIKQVNFINTKHTTERKFQRELQTWWKLRHPNILPLVGYIHEDENIDIYQALISPWVEGGTAADYIRLALNPLQRLCLFNDVINGLQYLHNFNPVIVHADLKPSNVLITEGGVGKICDFGLVRLIQEEMHTGLTTTTAHTGTIRYLAYELVQNMREAKPNTASDIYALGCIGMEFIFCHPPHRNLEHTYEILQAIGQGHPPAELPTDEEDNLLPLWSLLDSCWTLDPAWRPHINDIEVRFQLDREKILSGLQDN